jgi:hypothetical protein
MIVTDLLETEFLGYQIGIESRGSLFLATAEDSRVKISNFYGDSPRKAIDACKFGILKQCAARFRTIAFIVQPDIKGIIFFNLAAREFFGQDKPIRY